MLIVIESSFENKVKENIVGRKETEVRKGRNEAIDEKRHHEKDKWAGISCCDILKKIREI